MYLHGLGSCSPARTIDEVSADECHAAGGIAGRAANGPGMDPLGFGTVQTYRPTCTLPAQCSTSPGANVNVSVPTTTTISPQVSPNLIQQQQPQNSPIGASTSMTTPDAQEQSSIADMFAAQQAAADKRQQDLIDALMAQQAASARNTQSMQTPQIQYIPSAPQPFIQPAPELPVTPVAPQTDYSKVMIYIGLTGVVLAAIGMKRK